MKIWNEVHGKPQKEHLLCEQLWLRRIETYYPRIRVQPINLGLKKSSHIFLGIFLSAAI